MAKLRFILASLILASALISHAEGDAGAQNNGPKPNSGMVRLRNTNGKRIPSAIVIEFIFENGVIQFSESACYDNLKVCIKSLETGDEWYGTVSNANPSVAYTDVPGIYSVTCISNLGQIFVGEIQQ